MCLFTCQKCKSTINQRETTNHECEPAEDTHTAARLDAGARAMFIATMGGDTCAGDAWDEQPHDAPRKTMHRELLQAALNAMQETP